MVQTDVKRMMAYSSISHAGFILLGVQAASGQGTAAALFYLAAYSFMVVGSFGVITVVSRQGDNCTALADYQGLASSQPLLAAAFTVLLLAQTGVPLTAGFFAKFEVIAAAVDARSYWLGLVAMLAAVIGAFVYLRIIVAMYMTDALPSPTSGGEAVGATSPGEVLAGGGVRPLHVPVGVWLAVGLSVAVTLLVGFWPGLVASLTEDAVPALLGATPL